MNNQNDRHFTLAADIGGTNMRLAIIDQDGQIVQQSRVQAELSKQSSSSSEQAEQHIIHSLKQAMDDVLNQKQYPVSSVGIGFPGFFRGDSGILAASPNLPLLHDFPLADQLKQALGMPVFVQNDALCAAIGEHRHGAGQGQKNLLHITLGTGIGSGLILNHQPYCGEHGMAMEFGHLCIEHHNGRLCGCGNHGCVEAYASATAVVKRFNEREQTNNKEMHAKDVYTLALQGNDSAKQIMTETGRYLGMAIAEAIKLLDVNTVSISGGLSSAWDLLHAPLQDELNANLIAPLKGQVTVLRSSLGDHAGLLGAAVIAQP